MKKDLPISAVLLFTKITNKHFQLVIYQKNYSTNRTGRRYVCCLFLSDFLFLLAHKYLLAIIIEWVLFEKKKLAFST